MDQVRRSFQSRRKTSFTEELKTDLPILGSHDRLQVKCRCGRINARNITQQSMVAKAAAVINNHPGIFIESPVADQTWLSFCKAAEAIDTNVAIGAGRIPNSHFIDFAGEAHTITH